MRFASEREKDFRFRYCLAGQDTRPFERPGFESRGICTARRALAVTCLRGTHRRILDPCWPQCKGTLGWCTWSAFCAGPCALAQPKVLIFQSASARAGADRTFFGSVPWAGASRRADEGRGYGARICCVWSSRPVVRGSELEDGTSVQENVDHVSAVCKWNVKRISASAIV